MSKRKKPYPFKLECWCNHCLNVWFQADYFVPIYGVGIEDGPPCPSCQHYPPSTRLKDYGTAEKPDA